MLLGFHHRDDAQAFVAVQTTADRERQLATWQRLDASDDPAEARRALAAVQLLARVDAAQGPEDLPRRTDAKNLIGNHYNDILDSLERDAVVEIRKFHTGKQGTAGTGDGLRREQCFFGLYREETKKLRGEVLVIAQPLGAAAAIALRPSRCSHPHGRRGGPRA
jgi:hypothetical protein